MSAKEKCALCGNEDRLLEGHLIPKFAVEWLKRTSATPYLRAAHNPNLRKQDIDTVKLLCSRCENLFSKWEKQFREKIFVPYNENGEGSFEYGEWLIRFVVSLAWRTAIREAANYHQLRPGLAPYIDEAVKRWSLFLQGKTADAGVYEHHVVFLNLIEGELPDGLPGNLEAYLLRAVDSTLASNTQKVSACTLLPGIFFWSAIQPPMPAGEYANTLIAKKGTLRTSQTIGSDIGAFLINRARQVHEQVPPISERQSKRIEEAIRSNLSRAVASPDYLVAMRRIGRKGKGNLQ